VSTMPTTPQRGLPAQQQPSELAGALSACRSAIVGLAVASSLINVLYLTGSFYMLEVYDRVLPSRSVPTLVGLSILAISLFGFQGVLDLLRSRIMVRIGRTLGENLSSRVYQTIARLALSTRSPGDGLQPLRDLDQIRNFLSSPGPLALLDLPWMPFYLVICFVFHVWIGVAALVGAVLLVSLTILTEVYSREPTKVATGFAARRNAVAEASRRNAEVVRAMGMGPQMTAKWSEINVKYLDSQQRASDVGGGFAAVSKVSRMALQSAVLGVGGYLVINQEASAGIIIAGSILSARALAPVDLAIANWRNFIAFRQSWARLRDLLKMVPAEKEQMGLPKPAAGFSVEAVSIMPPGDKRLVVQDVAFRLEKGNGLGIIGPSASGKSCLARALVRSVATGARSHTPGRCCP
jgi:PrtD family type I secretion system ABC transporter